MTRVCKSCKGTGRKKGRIKVWVKKNLGGITLDTREERIVLDVCKKCYGKGKM